MGEISGGGQTPSEDDFVKNLTLIEGRLNGLDHSNTAHDLALAASWIAFVQRGDANNEQTSYFIRDALPKILRAALRKKSLFNDEAITAVKIFLSITASFAATVLPKYASQFKDSQCVLLTELFDSKQPFYQRYGSTKSAGETAPKDTSSSGITSVVDVEQRMKFVNELDVGSCFDYFHEGAWELAIVEKLSEFRTEFEISLPESNVTKWVSVDSGPSIVAPYGTRVNALANSNSNSNPKSAYLDLTRDDDVGSASHSSTSISGNSDSSWLREIRVGMLVDAKDMQGIWYQGCVMEMKTMRVPASASPPLPLPLPDKSEQVTVLGSGTEVEAKPRSSLKTVTAGLRAPRSVQISEEYWVDRDRVGAADTCTPDPDPVSDDANAHADAASVSSTFNRPRHQVDWSAPSVDSSKFESTTEKPFSEGEEGEENLLPFPLPPGGTSAQVYCSPPAAAWMQGSWSPSAVEVQTAPPPITDASDLPPPPPLLPSPSPSLCDRMGPPPHQASSLLIGEAVQSSTEDDEEVSIALEEMECDSEEVPFANAHGGHKLTNSSCAEVDRLTEVLTAAPLALSTGNAEGEGEDELPPPLDIDIDTLSYSTVRAVESADPEAEVEVLPTIRSLEGEVSPTNDTGSWSETVLVRVAFLGLPEMCDEWHSVGNGCMAPLDSRSFGKRGDSLLREEVIFMVTTQSQCLVGGDSASDSDDLEDRRKRRFTLPRSSQCYRLYSPALMEVINIFGESQGFESLLNWLQEIRSMLELQCGSCSSSSSISMSSAASAVPALWTPLTCGIINSLGSLHRMLSPQFLLYLESKHLLHTASYLLRNMDQRDLRETPVELIETTLNALEGLSGSVSNAMLKTKTQIEAESGTGTYIPISSVSEFSVADLLYDIAMRYLECPYLNRRLAGLKMLTDLFKRVQATAAHPSGLHVTRTTFGANDGVSYRVVPLLPHLSITALSASVASSGILFSVFRGERAHESLMLRSVEILRMLMHEGCLGHFVLTAIWEAGHLQRERAAMGVLTEIIALMSAGDLCFLFRTTLDTIEPAAATVEIADLLSAMAIRYRVLVMAMPMFSPAPSCDDVNSMSISTMSKESDFAAFSFSLDPESDGAVVEVNKLVLLKLWCWAEDGSGSTDQVAVKCLAKLLEAIDIGVSVTVTTTAGEGSNNSNKNEDRDFPWGRHWQRTESLILCALHSLSKCRSVAPAVRLLEAFMCSWPLYAPDNQLQLASSQPPIIAAATVASPFPFPFPFAAPTRAAMAEYLESEYRISATMGACIGSLKALFNDSVKSISGPQHTVAVTVSGGEGEGVLSDELQAVLNDVMVGGSRVGFKEELMRTLDFLHEFLRCSESLMFGQEVIESIWRDVACQAVTAEEVNLVMKFLSRLILNASSSSTSSSTSTSTPKQLATDTSVTASLAMPMSCLPCSTRDGMLPLPRPTPIAPISVSVIAPMGAGFPKGKAKVKRKALCSLEAVQRIFKNMLCDKAFVLSPFYSLQAFNCTKKFFRWLNTDAGLMSEASPLPLCIVGPPSSLIGMEVFSDIIISCRWDSVASQAITFLTSLPLCLAAPLVEAGELLALRRLLLQQCTDQLAQAASGAVDPRTLTRLIMLLSGLLDESLQDKSPLVRSHGSMGRGAEIIVHISGTNKIKGKSGPVTMHANDTLGDLFSEVSRRVGIIPARLKIFRLAKEVNLQDNRKTLAQMRFGLSGSEQMLVSERAVLVVAAAPLVLSKTQLDGSNEESSVSNVHPPMKRSFSADDSSVTITTPAVNPLANTSPSISGECAASSSSSGADGVPDLTVSFSPDKLEMLFSLMESSQREVVDKIWDLVTRLPSSPSMLTAWLQLVEPSALHLLFHHPTHSNSHTHSTADTRHGSRLFQGTSVARLLYNLQIIEALLQRACKGEGEGESEGNNLRSIEATDRDGDGGCLPCPLTSDGDDNRDNDSSSNKNRDSSPLAPIHCIESTDPRLVSMWPAHFLSKGGVGAVCGAFDWLSSFMQVSPLDSFPADTASPKAPCITYGSSTGLVLQLFEITVRLMRSLMVRSAAASLGHSGDTAMLLRLLRSLQARRDFNPAAVIGSISLPKAVTTSTVTSMSPPFLGPMPPPPPPHREVEPSDVSAVDQSLYCMSGKKEEEIELLLHKEWCRPLSTNGQHLSTYCTQSESFDMARVQRTTVSLMMSLRHFSSADIFQDDSTDWAAKTTMRARRRLLYSVLDGLFAVWSVAAMTKPDILSNLLHSQPLGKQEEGEVDISVEAFLAKLILGVDVDGKNPVTVSMSVMKGDTDDLVAKWARQELESFLQFLSQLRSPLSLPLPDDPYHSHCEGFRRRVFRAFLALRPPLVSPPPSDPSPYTSTSLPPLSAAMHASASSLKEFFSLGVSLLGGSVVTTATTATTTTGHAAVEGEALSEAQSGRCREAGSSVSLSSQERMQISLELYDELQAAAHYHSAQFKSEITSAQTQTREVHLHFLGGTISTLHGLVNCSAPLPMVTHSTVASACGPPPPPPSCSPVMLQVLHEKGFLKFLLVNCLGLTPVSVESAPPSLCSDDHSRAAAYAILRAMAEWIPAVVHEVLRHLVPVYASFPPLSAWDFKPERDVRSSTGFVGLRNKGCTCYMNSLLQVLYMTPEVRRGILLAKTASYSAEEQEAAKDDIVLQLQNLFFNLKYGEKKAFSPDDWVFAYKDDSGLRPVNVLQQQDAQEFIQVLCERLSAQQSTRGPATVASSSSSASSEHPSASTSVEANGDRDRGNGLVSTAPSPAPSSSMGVGDLVKNAFGGRICNIMQRQEPGPQQDVPLERISIPVPVPENSSARDATREQEDAFVCLSVQVKGAKGLEHSLALFVESECIDDFKWEDDGPRVTISKKQCISQLPDNLIFHLKRFELNFDTFRREKVNDSFSFPMYLNMLPYTKEGLKPLSPSPSPPVETLSPPLHPSSYYQYELTGVVVHTGTTDSGHYYAYIKDSSTRYNSDSPFQSAPFPSSCPEMPSVNSDVDGGQCGDAEKKEREGEKEKENRWFEFNDSEVSVFSEASLDAECFGGITKSYDYSVSTISKVEAVNPKSAYMLIYRRTVPAPPTPIACPPSRPETVESRLSTDDGAAAVIRTIKIGNARHTMAMRLADNWHLEALSALIRIAAAAGISPAASSSSSSLSPSLVGRPALNMDKGKGEGEGGLSSIVVSSRGREAVLMPLDVFEGLLAIAMDFAAYCSPNSTAREILNLLTGSVTDIIARHSREASSSSKLEVVSDGAASNSSHTEEPIRSVAPVEIEAEVTQTSRVVLCSSQHEEAPLVIDNVTTKTWESKGESERQQWQEGVEAEEQGNGLSMPCKRARLVNTNSADIDIDGDFDVDIDIDVPLQSDAAAFTHSRILVEETAKGLAKKVADKGSFDRVIALLYCPDQATRLSYARLLLAAFQLMALSDGAAAFCVTGKEAEEAVSEDLLNADMAFSPSSSSFSSTAQEDRSQQQQAVRSSGASNAEGVVAFEDEDEEIAMAIKLSMQSCSDVLDIDSYSAKSVVPLVVAVPISAEDDAQSRLDNGGASLGDMESVVEMTYLLSDSDITEAPTIADAVPCSITQSTSASASDALESKQQVGNSDVHAPSLRDGKSVGSALGLSSAARFLLELTRDARMQLIAENWRRADAVTWLLLSISQLCKESRPKEQIDAGQLLCREDGSHRMFLLHRQLLPQLVSIFTGDVSAVKGLVGTRKTAPSSSVVVGPPSTRGGPDPASSKNIPDWTHLLGCIVFLATGEGPEDLSDVSVDQNSREQSLSWHGSNSSSNTPALDCASSLSVTSRTLYSTALKQSRYAAHLTVLVLHFSYDCISFSDMISDLLLDALFQCSAENTAHIFSIMEAFLSIADRHQSHRAVSMFKKDSGPLNMLKGIHEQAPKKRLVCVCIRSLMTLVQRVAILREALTTPTSVINTWAPWMLKFAFIFMNDSLKDSASAAADRKTYSSHTLPSSDDNSVLTPQEKEKEKGPYIVVHGESDEEREATWSARAESANNLLHTVLISVGAVPDSLIPEDTFALAFDTPLDATDTVPSEAPVPQEYDGSWTTNTRSGTGAAGQGITYDMTGTGATERERGAFIGPVAATSGQSALTSKSNSSTVPADASIPFLESSLGLGLADGMTDEQLAEYLQSNFT